MPKETNLALLDETLSLSSKTEITTTPTVYDPSGRKVGWPAFPKELGTKNDFICPYCFTTCPAKYRGKAHWRAHLIQDLQPYTCTAQACTEGDNKPLSTWEKWIVHEQVYHRMEYMCPYHPEQTFGTREMYPKHIAKLHPKELDKLLKGDEIDKNAQLAPRPHSGCPLCSYEAETWADMDKHLAFHMKTLAVLSLPLATGLERDDVRMESLPLEGGEDDAMQLLDDDAAGVLSSIFETEVEPVDKDGSQLSQGERITPAALEELDSKTLALTSEDGTVRLWCWGIVAPKETLVDVKDDLNGQTPLSRAAENGDEAVVKLLLDTGKVDVDAKDKQYGRTALSYAAENGHEVVAKLLLETGEVDADLKDSSGRTPLLWAVANRQEVMVKLLLETYKVDADSKDSSGRTPLLWAAATKHESVVKLLLETGKVDAT